jgi:hypothetical protein
MRFRISILKFIAWTIIGLWFTRWIIFRLINIEFATVEIARTFRQVWIILIPIAIGILIYKSWTQKTTKTKKTYSLTLGILISAGLIVVLNFFSSFCEWQFDYIRYEHKTENMKIQSRFFDCGATTSGEPYELVETQQLGKYLIKYKPIEETNIDTTEWNKKN